MDLWCISVILIFLQNGHFALGLLNNRIFTKERLARINSTDDFIREFVVGNFEITHEPDGEAMHISGQRAKTATFDRCEPRFVSVPLEKDEDSNAVLWPPCTRVMQCSGCCPTDLLACEPIETETLPLKVVRFKIPYQGSPEFTFDQFKTIYIKQHKRCDQRCRVKEQDCDPLIHHYLPDDCRCKCKSDRPARCPNRQEWKEATCSCECLNRKTCGVFQRFDESTCECDIRQVIASELTEEERQELRMQLTTTTPAPPTQPPCSPFLRTVYLNDGSFRCEPLFQIPNWRQGRRRRRRGV